MVVLVFEPGLSNNGSWFWIEVQWNYTGAELTPTLVRHRYRYDTPALAGSESLRGYRQALVTVTPQAGEQLTALSLQDESWAYSSFGSWLDVAIASPVLAACSLAQPLACCGAAPSINPRGTTSKKRCCAPTSA